MQSAPGAMAETNDMTLRPGFAAPGRSPRSTHLIDERLDLQPARQHRGQHDTGVRDRPLASNTTTAESFTIQVTS